jgi:hypothetical protein
MKSRTAFLLAVMALALAGCAGVPQQAVPMNPEVALPKAGRVGVAMTPLPKVDTHFPGAGCLLCMAAASVANSSLTTHTQKLPYEDLPGLKEQVAALLRKRGAEVTVIAEPIMLDALPGAKTEGPNLARKDHTALRDKYNVDKLVVLNVATLGMWRTYSAYIPTSDPKGAFIGLGYMVNLRTNAYEWYEPVGIYLAASGNWDEPPGFPGLTNAYYQALEQGKDRFLKPFGN